MSMLRRAYKLSMHGYTKVPRFHAFYSLAADRHFANTQTENSRLKKENAECKDSNAPQRARRSSHSGGGLPESTYMCTLLASLG
jgi:hypothetical protein